jgi:hypothetical protein
MNKGVPACSRQPRRAASMAAMLIFFNRHHCRESALCFTATSRKRIG